MQRNLQQQESTSASMQDMHSSISTTIRERTAVKDKETNCLRLEGLFLLLLLCVPTV